LFLFSSRHGWYSDIYTLDALPNLYLDLPLDSEFEMSLTMDFPSSIYPSVDYSFESNALSPLPSPSNAPELPPPFANRTPASCIFAEYKLNIKKGHSLYEYLGYSEPSIKLNPLGKKISTFIKGLGADWPTTRPSNSCHYALESRNFANQFLDEENRGDDLWADPHGAKVWVADEME